MVQKAEQMEVDPAEAHGPLAAGPHVVTYVALPEGTFWCLDRNDERQVPKQPTFQFAMANWFDTRGTEPGQVVQPGAEFWFRQVLVDALRPADDADGALASEPVRRVSPTEEGHTMQHNDDLLRTGVWIDQQRASVVILTDGRVKMIRFLSGVEKHVRPSGGPRHKPPHGPEHIANNKELESERSQALDCFYGGVTDALRSADRIYLFGPGQAKHELEKLILRSEVLAPRIMAVHAEDKMTDEQIIAKVRAFYGMQPKRFGMHNRRPVG